MWGGSGKFLGNENNMIKYIVYFLFLIKKRTLTLPSHNSTLSQISYLELKPEIQNFSHTEGYF